MSTILEKSRKSPVFALGPRILFVVCALLFVSACDDDDDPVTRSSSGGTTEEAGTAELRVIHGSPDAPTVNVLLDGGEAINDLDYAQSSNYAEIEAGSYVVSVEGITPGGSLEVINVPDFEFSDESKTTIIAVNAVADIEPLVIGDSDSEPTGSEVALRVVHASPAAPEVDIYVTAPGDDINAAMPAFTFDYKEDVDAGALAAGSVQIRATLAGTKTVAFDTGEIDLTPFAGQKLLLVALSTVNPTAQAAAPIKLLVAADDASLVLMDVTTGSGARVIHVSSDAGNAAGGPVEVFASSSALTTSPTELIDAFSYLDIVPTASTHVVVPSGDYVFDVAPNTDMIGDSVFTSSSLSLAAGSEYTVVAAGRVASTPAFTLLVSADISRAVATQASIKVIHAAPAAGDVDVFVTAAGAYTTTDVENGTAGDPLLDDFAFAEITDYVNVEPGDYDVRVVAGGVTAINIEGLTLAAGSVSTVVARGPIEPAGAPSDFGVVLLTN